MKLICVKCNCEMVVVCGDFSTRPMYYICPCCKNKVKTADYKE